MRTIKSQFLNQSPKVRIRSHSSRIMNLIKGSKNRYLEYEKLNFGIFNRTKILNLN